MGLGCCSGHCQSPQYCHFVMVASWANQRSRQLALWVNHVWPMAQFKNVQKSTPSCSEPPQLPELRPGRKHPTQRARPRNDSGTRIWNYVVGILFYVDPRPNLMDLVGQQQGPPSATWCTRFNCHSSAPKETKQWLGSFWLYIVDYDTLACELHDFSSKLGERGNNYLPAARNNSFFRTFSSTRG